MVTEGTNEEKTLLEVSGIVKLNKATLRGTYNKIY
jgi:hypothetical protein